MSKKISLFIVLILGIFFPFFSHAFEIPPVGDATDRVRDYAGVLNEEEEQILENKVHEIEKNTASQIAVVLISSLSGEDIDELGAEWAEKRGVGYKGLDNGIFVLIAVNDRQWRIDVGYGLEGAVPDITAWRIGNKIMVPYFKQGDYFLGINKSLDALSGAIVGEYTRSDVNVGKNDSGNFLIGFLALLFISIFGGIFVRSILGIPDERGGKVSEKELFQGLIQKNALLLPKDDKKRYMGTLWGSSLLTILGTLVIGWRGLLYFLPLYFIWKGVLFSEMTKSSGGSNGRFSGSGGWSSGGSSGSSFGGGSFGGGGSSGSW